MTRSRTIAVVLAALALGACSSSPTAVRDARSATRASDAGGNYYGSGNATPGGNYFGGGATTTDAGGIFIGGGGATAAGDTTGRGIFIGGGGM